MYKYVLYNTLDQGLICIVQNMSVHNHIYIYVEYDIYINYHCKNADLLLSQLSITMSFPPIPEKKNKKKIKKNLNS